MNDWTKETEGLTAGELLRWAVERWPGRVAFATSFGAEDQVILELLHRHSLLGRVETLTLDTGRLFPETVEVWEASEARYGLRITPYLPDASAVEAWTAKYGAAGYRDSAEARHACCEARKLGSLRRALAGAQAWICGLRRGQGVTRAEVQAVEWDASHGLCKVNPLWDWSEEDVWRFIGAYGVPYNSLHDRGYPSIGCSCCTRAVRRTEDARAGRWWWERPEHRECGLHSRPRS